MLLAQDRGGQSWRTASREPAGLAPLPQDEPRAVVQVYTARAFGWRGAFAVHSWIATKRAGANSYTTHQVTGWRSGTKIVNRQDIPDRYWYGSQPTVLVELRGDKAAHVIDEIEEAIARYPYADSYTVWPGPNSNTFVAWIGREVPALRLDLPPTAIGKDYLGNGRIVAPAMSGTGYQLSLGGLVGVTLGWEEGIEANLLGLTFGIDPLDLTLKLPGIGLIGPSPEPNRS